LNHNLSILFIENNILLFTEGLNLGLFLHLSNRMLNEVEFFTLVINLF